MFRILLSVLLSHILIPAGHAQDLSKSFLPASPGKNFYLGANQGIFSPSRNNFLIMQTDGNLVMYKSECIGDPNCRVSDTGSIYPPGSYFLAVQEDGNVVIYQGTPSMIVKDVYKSDTAGPFSDYYLAAQDDGNIVMYKGTGPTDNRGAIWSVRGGKIIESAQNARCVCDIGFSSLELKGGACGSVDCQRKCYQAHTFQYRFAICQGGTKQCIAGCQ